MINMSAEELVRIGVESGKYPRYIYKYCSINSNTYKALKKHYVWFSKQKDFNDPFEGRFVQPTKYREADWRKYMLVENGYIDKNPWNKAYQDEIIFTVNQIVEHDLKQVRVSCFTPINSNLLMWAHYANQHKGICLKFDILKDLKLFQLLLPVKYNKRTPKINYIKNSRKVVEQVLLSKPAVWKYENEWRVIKRNLIGGECYYNPEALCGVIFGHRVKPGQIRYIKSILGKSVSYEIANLSEKKCELEIRSL